LLVYKKPKPQNWFNRSYDAKTGKYKVDYGFGLTGPKKVWETSTTYTSLYLSRAVQLNSEPLLPIFEWFNSKLIIFGDLAALGNEYTVNMLKQDEGKKQILSFLAAADTSISDISVVSRKLMAKVLKVEVNAGEVSQELVDEEQEIQDLKFHHFTDKGKAVFGIENESIGTRRLLSLIGPIFNILNEGKTLIIDELDSSLHPLLVRRLVKLFHSEELNPNGAQLVFTSHDATLLSSDLLRRDQVWFVEKDREQASCLYPLSDFSPRKNEALENGYLAGRYGALPFFQEWHEA
jgi:hypothetical protein